MTRTNVSSKITEIEAFITNFRGAMPPSAEARQGVISAYRQFHALLIWKNVVDADVSSSDEIKLYINEGVADISSGMMCALLNMYKPCRMMLRSSIENFMRVSVFVSGGTALSAKTTYELSALFNSGSITVNPDTNKGVQAFLRLYDTLCKYVHTATPMHMDLRIPFNELTKAIEQEFTECMGDIVELSSSVNKLLSFLMPKVLSSMHHHDRDYILDCLPASLKKAISGK